jgi:GT2 family glycosyltransferase
MHTVSIITVNFNQPAVTLAFLKSVQIYTDPQNVEVILVDNGCSEDHEVAFKTAFPELHYVKSTVNLGFAGGNNLGISKAKGEYLLLLNNDTEITANFVETLLEEFRVNPEIGMLSPLILYFEKPEIIQYAGFTKMNYLTCRNKGIGSMQTDKGQFDSDSRETAYCHGAAMMCRKDDLRNAGLMAEHFFLYYEELDWCEQFKKSGKKIWFTGKTRIYHKESISVGKESGIKTYFMTRNRMLFIRRNTSWPVTIVFSLFYLFIASPKQIIKYILKGRKDLVKWVIRGIGWNFRNSRDSITLGFKI